ncbi:MAG: hypothetical protein R3F62_32105, partial [Planctomycetota bacterium]
MKAGCATYGCEGPPRARLALTPARVVGWTLAFAYFVPVAVWVAGHLSPPEHRVLVQWIGGALAAVGVALLLLRVERANAAAQLRDAQGEPPGPRSLVPVVPNEAIEILTLGGIGGAREVQAALDRVAEGAPPPPKVPLGAELPDACPE